MSSGVTARDLQGRVDRRSGLMPFKAEVKSTSVGNEIRRLLLPWLQRGHN